MTTDDKIRAAIKVECDRQHVGEDRQQMLYREYLACRYASKGISLVASDIRLIARFIEPSNNGQFRTTPVTFNGIVGGVSPDSIPRAMESWVEFFNDVLIVRTDLEVVDFESHVDYIIKKFLDIHPFSDGNGRTAWLLRVWLLNQWDDPQPLPDYYDPPYVLVVGAKGDGVTDDTAYFQAALDGSHE